MVTFSFPCFLHEQDVSYVDQQLLAYSDAASCYGFMASVSKDSGAENGLVSITISLLIDDEKIEAMRGAKRGPKFKATSISVEEMAALRDEGVPPQEIAKRAGIGVATYFRRMAAYRKSVSED